jgi:hypothetical protein
MQIAYGPPGAVGVKSLEYVSGVDGTDDADYVTLGLNRVAKPISAVALGTWIFAWAMGLDSIKRKAFAVSIAAFAVQVFTKPK